MAAQTDCVKLAQSLPPRLLRFFARYPPLPKPVAEHSSSGNTSATPNQNANDAETWLVPSDLPNPFKPHKNATTGKWHDPVYSLRRQADLVKLARAHRVEELLPFTTKATEERIRRRVELGLRVKGTGVGQRVKGKKWERTMRARLDRRKQAMLEMPAMIQQWKQTPSDGLKLRLLTLASDYP
ncbi:MAG: hypothetical protein Q9167_006865 [Letrouitia subvulpina]